MTNKFIEILLFIFIFIPACLYITLNKENIDINDFREASGYDLVELSDGITAYKDIGNKSDKTIVLIHGATFGSLAYEDYLDVFVSNNYRVIIYDQYGRGYSDRLTGDISIELMERQLSELIEYCEIDNVILYGVSFGAAVAAKYAASNIDKIDFIGYQVPLINSADVPLLWLVKAPLYGNLLSRALLVPTAINRIRDYEDLMSSKLFIHFTDQFKVIGTEKFFTKFFLSNAMGNRLDDHNLIGSNNIPSYFAYSDEDIEINAKDVEIAIKNYNNPIVKKYPGGHFFSSGIEKKVAQEFINNIEI